MNFITYKWQKKKKAELNTFSLPRMEKLKLHLEVTLVRLLHNTLMEILMKDTSLRVFVKEEVLIDMPAMEKSTRENGSLISSTVLEK